MASLTPLSFLAHASEKHLGKMLAPPFSLDRLEEMGGLVPTVSTGEGDSWSTACMDVVVSGLATGARGLACKRPPVSPLVGNWRRRGPSDRCGRSCRAETTTCSAGSRPHPQKGH